MTLHTLGEISLTFSTIIYILWLFPQLQLNFQRKSTQGLSFWLHTLLFIGYGTDLIYGFGFHMEWQYRLVTIVGLLCLLVQHVQFGYYGDKRSRKQIHYRFMTIVLISFLLFSIYVAFFTVHSSAVSNVAGMISNISFFSYVFPQIIKNYYQSSVEGLSFLFVFFTIILGVCDMTSAMALHWSWPSFVGPFLGLSTKMVLLLQIFTYRGKELNAVCV